MKRLMHNSLISLLQNNRNVEKADCFVISLPNGQKIYATDGQWDITFPFGTPGWTGATTTFKARDLGVWKRGNIVSEADTKCASNTMSLQCSPQKGMTYPGTSLAINSAAFHHLFDGCEVFVYTAYWLPGQYGQVSTGIETKWRGTIVKSTSLTRGVLQFECADPSYLLNAKIPARIFGSNCGWAFCDDNCTLDEADFTVTFTADAASTQNALVPTVALTQPDGYFVQGVVTCLTGANAGLSLSVKISGSLLFIGVMPWLLPIEAGDTFKAIKGCDKTLATCKAQLKAAGSTVDNSINFPANPFTPPPASAAV
jgi:uncharacterized phage protein (TIGR02218 family)